MAAHLYKVTILPTDLDPTGQFVMWDATFRWYVESHRALFRERGLDFGELFERGYTVVVAADEHKRRIPISQNAQPLIVSRVNELLMYEIPLTQAVMLEKEQAVRSKVELVLVKENKAVVIPDDIRAKLRD